MTPDKRINTTDRRGHAQTTIHRMRTVEDLRSALDWAIAKGNDPSGHFACSALKPGSWSGTSTAEEYQTMLRDGWPEGVNGVEGLDGLSTDASDKIEFVRNVGGAFPIVPAYLSGAPDAMLRPVPMPADSVRGLTLVVDSSFSCGVKSEEVLTYAASVMRLIAWLQAEGVETSIYSVITIREGRGRLMYTVPIRETGDIMQPERIASLVHTSFLRRAWFALVKREAEEAKLTYSRSLASGGYGYPQTATTDELKAALPDAYSVILLPKVGSGDPEKAVKESYTLRLKGNQL